MMSKHTGGTWRRGKPSDAIVSDKPTRDDDSKDAVGYYGGHLIAESVAPQNVPIIIHAPKLLAALRRDAERFESIVQILAGITVADEAEKSRLTDYAKCCAIESREAVELVERA